MMKFINNYQLALYLKGKASPKDIQRYLYLYGWDDSYKDIKWIYKSGSWNDDYKTKNNAMIGRKISQVFKKYEDLFKE